MAAKKRASSRSRAAGRHSTAHKTISEEFLTTHRAAIERAMRANLRRWGAHGWSVVGKGPDLRLEVSVPTTVQHPARAVDAIRVGGRTIKPSVRATQAHLRRERADGFDAFGDTLGNAVAPGARIRVGRGAAQELVGVAAVLDLDGRPAILTCGHASAFSLFDEILAGGEPDGESIATLETNLLEGSEPLDAAICPLTDAGVQLLEQSSAAPTWRFKNVRAPSVADNDELAVFWDTHDDADFAPTAGVRTFSGETSALFGPRGPRAGFIETGHAVVAGDSGSLLSLGSELYGLCSGFVGFTAFFTPIQSVIERLQREGIPCSVFTPVGD